jgi:hypothetical protein
MLNLISAILGQIHVQFMPHMSKWLSRFVRQFLEALCTFASRCVKKSLIEGVALTSDNR